MSKQISAALKAHLASETTTLATCWKATLRNGSTFGFTDHTRNISFEGVLYKSSTGYTPTAVETTSMLNIDNMEVEVVLDSPDVTKRDLLAGLWDAAKVETFWVNYEDLTMGKMWRKTGTIGQLSLKGTSFVSEVRGLTQAYATNVVKLVSATCRATLGDSTCKVKLARYTGGGVVEGVSADNRTLTDSTRTEAGPTGGFTITGVSRAKEAVVLASGHHFVNDQVVTITGVQGVLQMGAPNSAHTEEMVGSGFGINGYHYNIGNVVDGVSFTIPVDTRLANDDALLGPAPALQYTAYISGGTALPYGSIGFYDFGLITFTSGANAGLSMEVKKYTVGVIELQLPMPYPVAVGDNYTIVTGCGKRFVEDCVTKFNNGVNFQGEPDLPGIDKVMRVGGPSEASPSSGTADVTAQTV